MTTLPKLEAEWMRILRADIEATGSISKTAKRIGVSRPAISQILNGIGHYGSGRASTARVEEKVMHTIGMVACPFLTEYHGAEHRITGLQCREYAYRDNPPINNPREMQHWRACQGCEKRVKAPLVVAFMSSAINKYASPVQQAGIIDTVTLPLPEVGAPQIQLNKEIA